MTQHINLLTKRRVYKGVVWLSIRGIGVLLVLSLALASVKEYRLFMLKEQGQGVQEKIVQLNQELESRRRAAGLEDARNMEQEMAVMRQKIDTRKDLLDLIQKGELGDLNGYSPMMQALATISEDGVWLQGLEVKKSGESLVITGGALNSEALMRYANKINQTFKPMDINFASMEISRETLQSGREKVNILRFKLY